MNSLKQSKSKFRVFCESLDLLGEKPSLTLNKKANFKTYFGGLITLLFYLLCLLSMVYYAIFIFSQDPVQVEYNSTFTYDFPTFDLWKGDFLLGMIVLQGNKFVTNEVLRTNFNITLNYEKISREVDFATGKITENVERYVHKSLPCNKNPKLELYKQYIGPDENGRKVLIDMANCFYPNPDDPKSENYFKVSSRPDSPPYEKLTLSVAPCNPAADSTCKGALNATLLSANYVYFVMPVVGIDSSNPDTPISYSADASYRLEYLPGIVTSATFSLKKTEVYNFHEEFLGGNSFIQEKISIDTRRMGWTTGTPLSPYFTLTFVSGNQKEIVVRTYFGPLNWMASIGGIMEILSLACAAIYYFYGEFFYGRYLLDEIYVKDATLFSSQLKTQSSTSPEMLSPEQGIQNFPKQVPEEAEKIMTALPQKLAVGNKKTLESLKQRLNQKSDFVEFLRGVSAMENFQDRILDREQKLVLPLILALEQRESEQDITIKEAIEQLYTDEPDSEFHREVNSMLKKMLHDEVLGEN